MTVAPTPLRERRTPHRHDATLIVVLALVMGGALLLARHDVFRGSTSNHTQGSGTAASQTRRLPPFTAVDLAGATVVTVGVGGTQSVVVHADDNLLDHVTTAVRSGSLVIGTKGSFTTKSPMRVAVTMPSLDALTLGGSGVVSADGINTARLRLALSGSGVLRVAGSASRLNVTLSGSGDARLAELVARDVSATVSGSGRILVVATNSLDASVPGSGAILYSGNPLHVHTRITGEGTVTPA